MKKIVSVVCSICLLVLALSSVTFAAQDKTKPITTASPVAGTYTSAQNVTLTRNEAGTTYFTTNGTNPTTSSTVYTAPINIAVTTTLKYFSKDTAGNIEAFKTGLYTITTGGGDTTAPVTTAAPAAGTYASAQNVTLTRNEAGTTYYTTNGTTPTTSSTVYSAPINIAVTTTLKYFSRDTAGNSEAVKTGLYTISTVPPAGHAAITWTGYDVCISCHTSQAQAMYQSVHYQWKGSAAEMTTGPATQGKMDATDGSSALNSYCINIQGNWGPCGACHAGTGAKPVATASPSTAQLASIDCLICHNDTVNAPYSRVRNAAGLFEPAAGLNMSLVAQKANIKPIRKNCLGCHAKAGGGDAVKRGDIALASGTTSDVLYDTHMAMGNGGNIQCQGCHTFTAHRVAGRGTDIRPQDSTVQMSCSTAACHSTKSSITSGHTTEEVNTHVTRVACQTCHINKYAKNANDTAATEATEMHRDWQHNEWNATLNRYEPLPTKANDQIPKYAFWNGKSWGNNSFDAAVIDPTTGAYKQSRPNGAINDAVGTKLFPFKYKTATQALASGKIVTLSTATFFATGNYNQAVLDGMAYMGITGGYTTINTDEFQLLNHQVPTAVGNVLTCANCHESTTYMNLKTMGYALKGPTTTVCAQCHRAKTPGDYTRIHSHIAKGYDCSLCHNFSRPERGLKMTPN